jgi:acetoin utilization protein AcuB
VQIATVKNAMTPFPHTVEANAPLREAHALMAAHRIRHLPVKDGGSVVGVVSDRDLEGVDAPSERPAAAGPRLVRDVMDPSPYVVDLDEPLERVLATLAERRIGCALVVKEDRLAGIFTATDACRVFAQHLRALRESAGDDIA